MCRLLVVNNAETGMLEDKTRMYLNLLGLPVELEIASDYSSAAQHLCSNQSYDILMTQLPLCSDGIAMMENARSAQPQMKQIFLTDTDTPPRATEGSSYCLLPKSMSISSFYDVFCQVSPETVKKASGGRKSNRWFGNHDVLLDRILRVMQIIREEYMEDISLNYLAEQVYSSPCYLSTQFAKYVGISPMAYVNEFRMKTAVDLLLNTDISVTKICQQVGYRNLPYFCTCFKSKYHMTPAQFRQHASVSTAS